MSSEVKRFQAVPGFTAATLKLIERLKDGKIGDELTDTQLASVAGEVVKVGSKGYCHLLSAIRYTTRNHRVLWQRVPKAGAIRCLNSVETIAAGESHYRRAGREAKRGITKLKTLQLDQLQNGERTTFLTTMAQLGVIAGFGSKGAADRIDRKKLDTIEQATQIQKQLLESLA